MNSRQLDENELKKYIIKYIRLFKEDFNECDEGCFFHFLTLFVFNILKNINSDINISVQNLCTNLLLMEREILHMDKIDMKSSHLINYR